MRPAPVLLLLLLGCGPDTFRDKTPAEWAAALEDPEGGEAAMRELERAEAVPTLAAIVRGERARARIQAAAVLGRLGPAAAGGVPALVDALKSKDPGLRGMAAIALGRLGETARPALVALDRALSDPEIPVRVAAALAVYGIAGDHETAETELLRALGSPDPRVRAMVTEGLGQLGERSVDVLLVALADEDGRVRAIAAETLADLAVEDPDLREARRAGLQEALLDEEPAVRAAALAALRKLPE